MSRRSLALIPIVLCLLSSISLSARAAEIIFEAESDEFDDAVAEYQEIWAEDGSRIVETLERITCLSFESKPIPAIIYEGASSSGYREIPMRLRASYPSNTKRGTLVHELSHRLIADLVDKDVETHSVIFLFLYDAWVELWGREFAESQVAVESQRRGIFDYEAAWKSVLSLTAEERSNRWQEFLRKGRYSRKKT